MKQSMSQEERDDMNDRLEDSAALSPEELELRIGHVLLTKDYYEITFPGRIDFKAECDILIAELRSQLGPVEVQN